MTQPERLKLIARAATAELSAENRAAIIPVLDDATADEVLACVPPILDLPAESKFRSVLLVKVEYAARRFHGGTERETVWDGLLGDGAAFGDHRDEIRLVALLALKLYARVDHKEADYRQWAADRLDRFVREQQPTGEVLDAADVIRDNLPPATGEDHAQRRRRIVDRITAQKTDDLDGETFRWLWTDVPAEEKVALADAVALFPKYRDGVNAQLVYQKLLAPNDDTLIDGLLAHRKGAVRLMGLRALREPCLTGTLPPAEAARLHDRLDRFEADRPRMTQGERLCVDSTRDKLPRRKRTL